MLAILNVLTIEDTREDGDFWREQTYVSIPAVERPADFRNIVDSAADCFHGKRIAVPKMYVGGRDPKAKPTVVSQEVIDLYRAARKSLEALGAIVEETDFPLVANYEDDSISGETNNVVGFKPGWNSKERGELVAYLWDDFLIENGDTKYPNLSAVDGGRMFPRPADYVPDRYMEHKNFMDYPRLVELARERNGKSIWDIDGLAEALPALEAQRKRDLDDWMDSNSFDLVAFPAAGDVGKADLDTNDASAAHALQNGVKYSNGNRAIRVSTLVEENPALRTAQPLTFTQHMGVPTVSVSMGLMAMSKMPVNLTFAGKHGQDIDLLRYAYAFEQQTKHRIEPPVTPVLGTDRVTAKSPGTNTMSSAPPEIDVLSAEIIGQDLIRIMTTIKAEDPLPIQVEVFVDGREVPQEHISRTDDQWIIETKFAPYHRPQPLYGGLGLVIGNINVLVLVCTGGCATAKHVAIPMGASSA